jgi:D-beta-D-heptose 7-phosphate kinase/D-beta-D-heptose 1-phosphate adenosyltransferase
MKKIIVNGSFDMLHLGHIRLLKYAKSLGDYLVVCTDTDRRIKELKGASRPIQDQVERVEMLSSLRVVDEVRTFDSEEALELIIKNYQPDIMVKGSDYRDQRIVGEEYCKEIIFFERIDGYSTTNTIKNIANR